MNRFDEYEILQNIGSGAFASVYHARHKETGIEVALKEIPKENPTYPKHPERVEREIKLAETLDHPFIASAFEVLEDSNFYYIALEYCHNGNILSYINENGPMSEAHAQKVFSQLLAAIDYCHEEQHVVHRDLKAENVMIDKFCNIRLIDFGLAHEFTYDSPLLNTACGSPAYAAPEMIKGLPYTAECDIWSLGIFLYAVVMGELPFDDPNMSKLMNLIVYSQPKFSVSMSADLQDLITKLLNKEPSQRPSLDELWEHPWVKPHSYYRHMPSFSLRPHSVEEIDREVILEMSSRRISCSGFASCFPNLKDHPSYLSYLILRREALTTNINSFHSKLIINTPLPISALRFSSILIGTNKSEAIPIPGVQKSKSQKQRFVAHPNLPQLTPDARLKRPPQMRHLVQTKDKGSTLRKRSQTIQRPQCVNLPDIGNLALAF